MKPFHRSPLYSGFESNARASLKTAALRAVTRLSGGRSLAIFFQGAGLSLRAAKESPPHRWFYSTPSPFFLSSTLDGTSYGRDLPLPAAAATTFSSDCFSISYTFLTAYPTAEETPAGRGSGVAYAPIVSDSCGDRVGG